MARRGLGCRAAGIGAIATSRVDPFLGSCLLPHALHPKGCFPTESPNRCWSFSWLYIHTHFTVRYEKRPDALRAFAALLHKPPALVNKQTARAQLARICMWTRERWATL